MKKTIVGIIGTLVVVLFGYYLNYEKPEIKYTISEGIPIGYAENESNEIAQQLEVKNVGNSEAKNIRLLIRKKIIDYKLQKYSEADEVKEFKTSDSLEIVYPNLPPQGGFRMIMKSTGVNRNNVDINHSRGKGVEALASRSSLSTTIFLIGFWLALVAIIVIMIILGRADYLRGKIDYNPDAILKAKRKPFFVKKEDWSTWRTLAIKKKLEYERFYQLGSVEKTTSYNILSIGKLDYLSDEEWNSLISAASKELKKIFAEQMVSRWKQPEDYLKLLNIPKPKNLADNDWVEIIDDINKTFFALKKRGVSVYFSEIRNILKEACSQRPEALKAELWDDYVNFLKIKAFVLLSEAMYTYPDPIVVLETVDVACLGKDVIDKLRKIAYENALKTYVKNKDIYTVLGAKKFLTIDKPDWLKDSDYDLMQLTANNTISLNERLEKYDCLLESLKSILQMRPLSKKKPDLINEEEWTRLLEMEKEIKVKGEENIRNRAKIMEEKVIVDKLKDKVERQLRIIDEMLINPDSINNIEDYSNVFASGNFENLKKIALLLKMK